ncbi:MAG: type IX secretion system plug protein domain-containing protein [Bacteroidota bacterium]
MSRFAPLLLLTLLAGCATTDGAGDGSVRDSDFGFADSRAPRGFSLVAPTDDIKTVQLHQAGDEASLPIVGLNSGQQLTLSFDLLDESTGRPLSVYFYHADRNWERTLLPVEYLASAVTDDLFDYRISGTADLRYVHYMYRFPNERIRFLRSGNYIVRVAEQGREQEPLFERAFFVSEQAAEVEMLLSSSLLGTGGSFAQPVVQFRPTQQFDVSSFDYDVCFARNGRFDLARCAGEPSLIEAALLQFYLPPERSFQIAESSFQLDLGELVSGGDILRANLGVFPYEVMLEPDFARFGNATLDAPLSGQPIIDNAVFGVGDPDTQAEYVQATFTYVPQDERPLRGPVILSGAFNGWLIDPANRLQWIPEAGRYEGTLLLKQGRYLYRYVVEDPSELERQRRDIGLAPSLYTALVYVRDFTRNTDRLIATRSIVSR